MALEGGCRWVQLRMKESTDDQVRPIAMEAQKMCRDFDATFIIDDRVHLVGELHADGVHLGTKDMPITQAREILGEEYIIGGTANTLEHIKSHQLAGADYIGCGPYRFTTTKKGLSPILGLSGYKSIISGMQSEGIDIPIVAIGGINAEDVPSLIETGLSGIAISSTILRSPSPSKEIQRLIRLVAGKV